MRTSSTVFRFNLIEVLIISTHLLLFIFLLFIGLHDAPDTPGYVDAAIIRSPVYPLFIDFFQSVFGSRYEGFLFIVQLILGFYAMYHFVKMLRGLFSINKWIQFGISIIIMVPYVLGSSRVGNSIISEALAYPFYLFFAANLIPGILNNNLKKLYVAAVILLVLMLTRGQFLFAVPATIVFIIYLAYINKDIKKYMLSLVIFISLPFCSNLIDKLYHKIYFDYFVSTPWTGIHIATLPFFVSDEEDYKIFKTKDQQEYFKKVYGELTNSGLTLKEFKKINSDSRGYAFYAKNSTPIANFTIDPIGRESFKINDINFSYVVNDKMSKSMVFPLIMDNFIEWLKFYIMNIVAGIGYERLLLFYPIFLIFSFIQVLRSKSPLSLFIFISFFFAILNIALVAMVQPLTFYRYTIYGDFLIYTSLLLILNKELIGSKP